MTHVETDIFSFQLALWDTQALLPHVIHYQVPPLENIVVQLYPHLQASLMDCLHE